MCVRMVVFVLGEVSVSLVHWYVSLTTRGSGGTAQECYCTTPCTNCVSLTTRTTHTNDKSTPVSSPLPLEVQVGRISLTELEFPVLAVEPSI